MSTPQKTKTVARGPSLQDAFLDALHNDKAPVSIFLVNGIKLQGWIDSFDQYSVLLRSTAIQVIYKRAISTIIPGRTLQAPNDCEDEPR